MILALGGKGGTQRLGFSFAHGGGKNVLFSGRGKGVGPSFPQGGPRHSNGGGEYPDPNEMSAIGVGTLRRTEWPAIKKRASPLLLKNLNGTGNSQKRGE